MTRITARSLAAIILVPLVIVAALVTFNLTSGDALEKEASALAVTLDQTLSRLPVEGQTAVAVLPLDNRTENPELDFMASGIAEANSRRKLKSRSVIRNCMPASGTLVWKCNWIPSAGWT